jgi:hypothetical protein
MAEKSEVGEGAVDACLSASANAKNGESVFCQSHFIHPYPLPLFLVPLKYRKAMAARTFSRLVPALANLRAGASGAQRCTAFRSFATEAGSNTVRISSHLSLLNHALYTYFLDDGS